MIPSIFKKHNNNHDRRSSLDCRPNFVERSDVEKFLNGKGRFKRQKEIAEITSKFRNDEVTDDRRTGIDRRSGNERRSNRDRRSGLDTRAEIDKFLQGERRSGLDRRSRFKDGYRSFKKARAFVRGLGLKSIREWRDYTKSGKKPDDIPVAPQKVYANDGWAGWNDWLGARAAASYLYQHRFFAHALAFLCRLGLVSNSKRNTYFKPTRKSEDIPANP